MELVAMTTGRRLADALIAGNAAGARKAMADHLEVARHRLLSRR